MPGTTAYNDKTGEVLVLDGTGNWVKPQMAENPQTGEKLYLDGADWKPLPTVAESQTTGQWLGDQAKFLGGRLANAAISVPGLPADLVGLEMRGLDYLSGAKTPSANPLEAFTGNTIRSAAHDYLSQGANALGYNTTPQDFQPRDPRNMGERLAGNVADFIGYGAGPGALSRSALTSAGTGAIGLTAAQEIAPDSTLAQVAGALIGHRAPEAIASRGASILPTTRAALRGPQQQGAAENLAAWQRLADQTGHPASVMPGQIASDYGGQQMVDAYIARSPGGQPGVLRANESQAKLLDEAIKQRASDPTGKQPFSLPDPTATGSKIIADFEASAEKFRTRQNAIESMFEKRIGANTRVPLNNTTQAIAELKARAASDPAIADLIQSSYLKNVDEAIQQSGASTSGLVGGGTLSYSAMRALRTDVGELLPKAGLLGDVSSGQLKKLYGALSADLKDIAKAKGVGPQWDRYNKWASDTYDKSQKVYDRITKAGEHFPEKSAKALTNLDPTSLRVAMKNLSPEGRSMVAGQMLLDAAKTKAAGAAAEDVSTSYQKFLGNIMDMKRSGKFDAAFGAPEFKPLRDTIDDIEKVSKAALRANKVAHDVSGAAVVRGAAVGTIGTLVVTGQIPAAIGLFAATFVGPAVAGRLMRSKAYLNWLSYARQHPNDTRAILQRLEMVSVRDRDAKDREALKALIPPVRQLLTEQPSQPSSSR